MSETGHGCDKTVSVTDPTLGDKTWMRHDRNEPVKDPTQCDKT